MVNFQLTWNNDSLPRVLNIALVHSDFHNRFFVGHESIVHWFLPYFTRSIHLPHHSHPLGKLNTKKGNWTWISHLSCYPLYTSSVPIISTRLIIILYLFCSYQLYLPVTYLNETSVVSMIILRVHRDNAAIVDTFLVGLRFHMTICHIYLSSASTAVVLFQTLLSTRLDPSSSKSVDMLEIISRGTQQQAKDTYCALDWMSEYLGRHLVNRVDLGI